MFGDGGDAILSKSTLLLTPSSYMLFRFALPTSVELPISYSYADEQGRKPTMLSLIVTPCYFLPLILDQVDQDTHDKLPTSLLYNCPSCFFQEQGKSYGWLTRRNFCR